MGPSSLHLDRLYFDHGYSYVASVDDLVLCERESKPSGYPPLKAGSVAFTSC